MKERKIMKKAWAENGIFLDPEEEWRSSASKYYFHKGIITSLWGNGSFKLINELKNKRLKIEGKMTQKTTGYTKTRIVKDWQSINKIIRFFFVLAQHLRTNFATNHSVCFTETPQTKLVTFT